MSEELSPKIITLEDAITYNDKVYKEITFARKMKGKDMLAGDAVQGNTRKEYAIISSMAGVPLPVFLELTIDDLEVVMEAAIPFMGKRAEARFHQAQQKIVEDSST